MNSIEELKNKTKIEAEELRKKKNSGLKKEITPIFLSEEKKELFKKEVLELVSIGNIVKLQNIKEFYNILESVPTITSKGIDELNRLKKKYGE